MRSKRKHRLGNRQKVSQVAFDPPVVPYPTGMTEDAPQQEHLFHKVFHGLR